jgi:hypothetical protein
MHDLWHLGLVCRTLLCQVKGCREVEDRLSVLDGSDAARGEARPVAQPINEVDDWRPEISREDEIPMRRMSFAVAIYRSARGDERLREHLASIDSAGAQIAVSSAIDVDLEGLEVKQGEKGI